MKEHMPIDLGRTMDSPSGAIVAAQVEDSDKKQYPMVYLEWDKPYNLPDGEFIMTVRARTAKKTEDKKNDKYSEDVEILSIESVDGGSKKKSVRVSNLDDTGDALDKIRKESYPEEE